MENKSDLGDWNNEMYLKHPTRRLFDSNLPLRLIEKSRFRNIIRLCGDVKGKKILEIGCEQGLLTSRVPDGYQEFIAIDISSRAIEDAKKLCSGKNVTFLVRDGTKRLEFPDGYFDVIICSETLEHVPNYPAMIQEIHRLLNPSGRLAVSVPYEKIVTSVKKIFEKAKIIQFILRNLEPHTSEWHVNSFDKKTLRRALEKYFKIEEIRYVPLPLLGPRIIAGATKKSPQAL